MGKLWDFLQGSAVGNTVREIPVSERLRDENGEPLIFRVRLMTCEDYRRFMAAGHGDTMTAMTALIVNQTLFPDFREASAIAGAGVRTPAEYAEHVLLAGEIATLADSILRMSGFREDLGRLTELAGN